MRRLVEIELGAAADQGEAEPGERLGHQRRIVAGIVEPGDVLIGGIADHQRDALFGGGRHGEGEHQPRRKGCDLPEIPAGRSAHHQINPS